MGEWDLRFCLRWAITACVWCWYIHPQCSTWEEYTFQPLFLISTGRYSWICTFEELEFDFDASGRAHFNVGPFKKMAGWAVSSQMQWHSPLDTVLAWSHRRQLTSCSKLQNQNGSKDRNPRKFDLNTTTTETRLCSLGWPGGLWFLRSFPFFCFLEW